VTVRLDAEQGVGISTSISGGDLLNHDSFLSCLFPDDDGVDTPNPANRFALAAVDMGEFSGYVAEIGRAYLWAQRLCGLQFPPAIISGKSPQV